MIKQLFCPTCGKAAHAPFTPFCGKRCADIDLGRWFKGDYAVPAAEADEEIPDESTGGEEG
ncbi:MAG: DNA gyrase inhibitor YacG [Pseudomonadota bacterium]|nr:DNA gyrase inhibitor YacG [Pseudomonadota bacterium]MDE3038087.1 DNA gyrase inhibitor YacG [Pseudomonadota bacterium]